MRDFPMFSTENGVGSLVLREIPYSGSAYVTIEDSSFPTEFLQECLEFCRMAGAEQIFAKGHKVLEAYPFHTAIYRMSVSRDQLKDTDAALFPVTEKTLADFRHIYNTRMRAVPNSAFMTAADGEELLLKGSGYFVHLDGTLLGIGMIEREMLRCVISCKPGAGEDVVLALNHAASGDTLCLDVASENHRAMRLYKRMGFLATEELSRWYKIF